MASPSYSQLCCKTGMELTKGFKNAKRKDEFATIATVKDVMSRDRLGSLYGSLMSEDAISDDVSEVDFVRMVEEKKLLHFLAVLMYAECSVEAAKAFVQKLVLANGARDWPQENPYLLPAEDEDLNNIFEDPMDVHRFLKHQRPFCTIVVGGPDMVITNKNDQRTLPWLSEELIGGGSFGEVFKVEVAEGHFTQDGNFDSTYTTPQVIARKDFITENAETSFRNEWKAIRDIFDSRLSHENIVKSFGTITSQGQPSKFSLLMPLANTDLDKYMQPDQEAIVNGTVTRQTLLNAAMGLSDGLNYLHSELKTRDGESLICYHMDLKPSNILVFDVGPNMSWKLSDFGLSRVKLKTKPDADASDISRLFRRRIYDQQSRATATVNRRGEGTFQPREVLNNDRSMNQQSDVWSLGCIISLLFTYMEKGFKGIEDFSELRRKHSEREIDVFYQFNKHSVTYSINKGVEMQHETLIKAAKDRSAPEGEALSGILKWLETKVLVIDQKKRLDAKAIHKQLKETLEKYKDMQSNNLPRSLTQSSSPIKTGKQLTESIRSLSDFFHFGKSATKSGIRQWRLDTERSMCVKGSDSSPNGDFLICWNDYTMKLFLDSLTPNSDSSSAQSRGSREQYVTSTGQHKLQGMKAQQPWRCGVLTNQYLIAATTGDTFNCYIFDVDLGKELQKYGQITLPHIGSGIHKLITSPKKSDFACILNDKDKCCSILVAEITTNTSTNPDSQSESLQSTDPGICLIRPKFRDLEWSSNQIKHVALQTTNEIYIVVHNTFDLSIHLLTIEPPKKRSKSLDLKGGVDNDEMLFTDMVCFSSSKTDVIVVVQTKIIFHFTFDGVDKEAKMVRHKPIQYYKILKIARNESGSIVALGKHSGRGANNVRLLLIKLQKEGLPPEAKELAELDGVATSHELKLSLLRGGDGSIVQVTAATPQGQHRVYRLDLSGLLDT